MIRSIYKRYKELIHYLVVGGLTTLVSLGSYYGLVFTVLNPDNPLQLQAANLISWICAVTFAYFTNRWFVFESRNPHILKEAASFYTSRVGTLLMEMVLMFLLVSVIHWNDKLVKLLVQILITVVNYIISKFIVFRGNRES